MTSTILPSGIGSTPIENLSYEQAFAELEAIVVALEAEESSLEDALALFERGQSLARYCAGLLDKAELKVEQLSGSDLVDFDPDR
jgi:exodeoxyribonuclease VII small subunit